MSHQQQQPNIPSSSYKPTGGGDLAGTGSSGIAMSPDDLNRIRGGERSKHSDVDNPFGERLDHRVHGMPLDTTQEPISEGQRAATSAAAWKANLGASKESRASQHQCDTYRRELDRYLSGAAAVHMENPHSGDGQIHASSKTSCHSPHSHTPLGPSSLGHTSSGTTSGGMKEKNNDAMKDLPSVHEQGGIPYDNTTQMGGTNKERSNEQQQ